MRRLTHNIKAEEKEVNGETKLQEEVESSKNGR